MTPCNGNRPVTFSDLASAKAGLQSDLAAVKVELKSDISAVKAELKSDISAVKTELKSDIKRLSLEIVRTREELATKKDFADLKSHLNRITAGLDKLTGMAVDNRRTLLVFDSILGKHDKRLSTLEARS